MYFFHLLEVKVFLCKIGANSVLTAPRKTDNLDHWNFKFEFENKRFEIQTLLKGIYLQNLEFSY